MNKFFYIFFTFLLSSSGCGKDDFSGPSDLQFKIIIEGADEDKVNGDGSGKITCIASAKNAVRYEFEFNGEDLQESRDGTLEYTFTDAGTNTYAVLVLAYSSSGEFISKTQSVRVYQASGSANNLVFSDEFDVDGTVDSEKWVMETVPPNNGSWWNGEQQHYTDRMDNAYVSDGTLKIVAKKEKYTFEGSTKSYTSARLNSKFSFTHGRIDVRAKLPFGEGTWPAIWTLGSNINSVGWPACGEIDIMEHWGHDPAVVKSSIHTVACSGGCPDVEVGERIVNDYADEFHVYSAEWTPTSIRFFIDNEFLYAYDPEAKTADNWPFTNDQFILLNVAMGGTEFDIDPEFEESVMEIDYVRVYK